MQNWLFFVMTLILGYMGYLFIVSKQVKEINILYLALLNTGIGVFLFEEKDLFGHIAIIMVIICWYFVYLFSNKVKKK